MRYTPGAALAEGARVALKERLAREGELHALAPWGAVTRLPAAALGRTPRAAAAAVLDAYRATACAGLELVAL